MSDQTEQIDQAFAEHFWVARTASIDKSSPSYLWFSTGWKARAALAAAPPATPKQHPWPIKAVDEYEHCLLACAGYLQGASLLNHDGIIRLIKETRDKYLAQQPTPSLVAAADELYAVLATCDVTGVTLHRKRQEALAAYTAARSSEQETKE